MKKVRLLFLAFSIILMNGCLTYHVVEYTIDYADDFNSGHFTVKYTDIRSSETEPEKQKKDFEELIEIYEDDMFLLDQIDEGIYVKDRQLYEKDGKIFGSYSGIFQSIKIDDNEMKVRNDERYILLDISPTEKIETNGKVYRSDNNALLVWPKDKKKLKIKKIVQDYDNLGYSILDYYTKWKN
jgi:uncharacterized surface protein with fasciclin (FAS1) repeats